MCEFDIVPEKQSDDSIFVGGESMCGGVSDWHCGYSGGRRGHFEVFEDQLATGPQ